MRCKLADICSKIGSGATPRGGKEAYCEKGISLVRSQNVLDFSFSHDGLAFINNEQAAKLSNVEVFDGDVLLNITGDSVARACIMDSAFLPARVNQHVAIVRGKKSHVLNRYLLYFLQWQKGYLLQLASAGATRNALTKGMLEQLEIDLPSLDEQKRIVAILGALDDKIELNNKINENLEQQAQAIFRSWFLDYLPFNSIKPTYWKFCTLGETTKMSAGGDKPKGISNIKSTEYLYPIYSNGLDNEGLYGYTNEAKIFAESVTVSARGTIGFVCLRHIPYVPIVRLVTLIPNENLISAKYLYLYLKQLHISGTGTTQQQLTVPDFRKTEILIPDKITMDKFTNLMSPMFNQIWANEEENIKLASLRDSLLPKLMSGEIEL